VWAASTLAPGPSGGPGALPPRRDARHQIRLSMSLVTAAVMFAPSLAHAQGITSHYLGTPAPALAPQLHLAQQYDPPSLPPEIMVPERRPGGRQRAAPPIAAGPLDPLPPEPTPMAPEAAPRVPLESEPNPPHCMVQGGGEREGAAVPQCWITEGATVRAWRAEPSPFAE
jgi:hypothetical protein